MKSPRLDLPHELRKNGEHGTDSGGQYYHYVIRRRKESEVKMINYL